MSTKTILKRSVIALAVVGFMGMTAVRAQTTASANESAMKDLKLDLGVDWYTKYIWRGMVLTNDPVLQPSATLSYKGFFVNAWGNVDVTDVNETDNSEYSLQELDFTVGYQTTLNDMVNVGVGYILYTFPGTGRNAMSERNNPKTSEVYASAGLNVILKPTLTVYCDIDETRGVYATFGIGHTFELTEALGLSLGGTVGWGSNNYHEAYLGTAANQGDTNALSDYNLSASLDYAVNDNISVSAVVAYSNFVDPKLSDLAETNYKHNENIYGGVKVGVSF